MGRRRTPSAPEACRNCRSTTDRCLRDGEHYPYRDCCKRCTHKPAETSSGVEPLNEHFFPTTKGKRSA